MSLPAKLLHPVRNRIILGAVLKNKHINMPISVFTPLPPVIVYKIKHKAASWLSCFLVFIWRRQRLVTVETYRYAFDWYFLECQNMICTINLKWQNCICKWTLQNATHRFSLWSIQCLVKHAPLPRSQISILPCQESTAVLKGRLFHPFTLGISQRSISRQLFTFLLCSLLRSVWPSLLICPL